MIAEGFVTTDGEFVSYTERIPIADISIVKGPKPGKAGLDVRINPAAFEDPILKERLPIDLRIIADKIENYKGA